MQIEYVVEYDSRKQPGLRKQEVYKYKSEAFTAMVCMGESANLKFTMRTIEDKGLTAPTYVR